jgi:DNA-binding HxlR family transcriptional regulator
LRIKEKVCLDASACPIARALGVIGEWWSLLIIRDSMLYGITRFNDFQRSLDISRNALTTRLDKLVECGVMERRPIPDSARYEYVLTAMGKDLGGVLEQLNKWGEKWLEKPQPAKKSKPRSAQISGRP